ncbi:IS701 family transposase [Saccharothrix sp. ALI-22-I]|uniref:IS701 family transposase n=1 Tax=Saccharothrix sp. ALI-22-I TaxID=1933778 RepID=UPI001931039A|nr:IS701 family transposase [Saccharothrix sp. ALI-22-I]
MTVQDIAGWDADLQALTEGLGWMFNRPEPKVTFGLMVRALLADVPKKNSWGLAEHAGLATPRPFEHLLDGAVWDADTLRDQVRDYVVAGLGSADAAVIADDTQAIKKGDKSVGVAPQHCGLTGQTENCQVMPMLTYATEAGHAFIDRELYLPASWTSDPDRCRTAGVPADREFATKPQLVQQMLARVLAANVVFGWFAADAGYGRDPGLRAFCHDRAVTYVMAVPVDLPLVDARGQALCCKDILRDHVHRWERRSAGAGSKGHRLYDWAMHAVTVKEQPPAAGYGHTLLIRRSKDMRKHKGRPASYDIEYFLVHAPVATTLAAMVRAAGLRWKIEEDNKTGKDQLGMDAYQVRKWVSWHRHVTMCMLAQAFLAVTRAGRGKEAACRESEAAC